MDMEHRQRHQQEELFIAGTVWPAATNIIDYVQIMSTGNAIDFGDLIDSKTGGGAFGCSNGHGGL